MPLSNRTPCMPCLCMCLSVCCQTARHMAQLHSVQGFRRHTPGAAAAKPPAAAAPLLAAGCAAHCALPRGAPPPPPPLPSVHRPLQRIKGCECHQTLRATLDCMWTSSPLCLAAAWLLRPSVIKAAPLAKGAWRDTHLLVLPHHVGRHVQHERRRRPQLRCALAGGHMSPVNLGCQDFALDRGAHSTSKQRMWT